MQTISSRAQKDELEKQVLSNVCMKMEQNDAEIVQLTDELGKEYLSKAWTIDYMIGINPGILATTESVQQIAELMGVDEVHVSDPAGIIQWTTVPEYVGFDFTSTEQSSAFVPLLNEVKEVVQEPTPNGAEGKRVQYIGVRRSDQLGIIQVGITPDKLGQALANNTIDAVLSSESFGDAGFVFAVSKEDALIQSYSRDAALVGTAAADAGINMDKLNNEKAVFLKINGEKFYCNIAQTDDYYVIAAEPIKELYGNRNLIMVISVKELSEGRKKEISCNSKYPEFSVLTDVINHMVQNIEEKSDESMNLLEKEEEIFDEITHSSGTISGYAEKMQSAAELLAQSVEQQSADFEEITQRFANIAEEAKESSGKADQAARLATSTEEHLISGSEKMEEMQNSMKNISDASKKIGDIIKTIDDIAFQTNILALNAAVEVRNLANKSAEAAKDTTRLIDETLHAIKVGSEIASEATETFISILEETKTTNEIMQGIVENTMKQAENIAAVNEDVLHVAGDVQRNKQMAVETEQTVAGLNQESIVLKQLVERK